MRKNSSHINITRHDVFVCYQIAFLRLTLIYLLRVEYSKLDSEIIVGFFTWNPLTK